MQLTRSFRLVCPPDSVSAVETLLRAEGYAFIDEPFYSLARRLSAEPFPLGSSLAAFFGYVYIQDRSSMLPPLVLAPAEGAAVLDMCASPGSKTGLLGQLCGPGGFVLGNEPSKNRLATLRRNLQGMNLVCCATSSYPGEELPFCGESWNTIQLDPPCSGWGTAEKNPLVMTLWQGEKVNPLVVLQRRLLAEAARMLRPGGTVVYSTCTTNVRENEEQLAFAVDELGLNHVPVAPPEGFAFADVAQPRFSGALRVENGPDGQGFFVALLQKAPQIAPPAAGPEATLPVTPGAPVALVASGASVTGEDPSCARSNSVKGAGSAAHDAGTATVGKEAGGRSDLRGGFFVRPWEKESRFVGERKRHGRGKERERPAAPPRLLPREALEGLYMDTALLPDGDVAVFNGQAYFLPDQSREYVPEGFVWKAFPLGKMSKDGRLRLASRLRCLMPSLEEAQRRGLDTLNLEDVKPLADLRKGQSIAVDAKGPELGVYYRGLPLCRLAVKGKRAVLPV